MWGDLGLYTRVTILWRSQSNAARSLASMRNISTYPYFSPARAMCTSVAAVPDKGGRFPSTYWNLIGYTVLFSVVATFFLKG